MGSLEEDLARPEAYGGGTPPVRIDTHVSRVFLREDDVFKVKRPVNLGFLDFTGLAARREACAAEVRLNERLAPGVYLGICEVRRDRDGRHHVGGEGELVDFAVHMRRLPDERRADVLLAGGRLGPAEVEHLARVLVDFHARARCDEHVAGFGRPEVIRANVEENFAQTRGVLLRYLDAAEAAEVERRQLGFLEREADRLRARALAGRVRDGHGDLRLEHVYFLDEGVRVVDCIEFNERFRFADVAADLSFLTMDLAWHGRVDLAERLLAAYARDAGDFDLYPLADFYESYRAFVRGKIAALLAGDGGASGAARARGAAEARRYFLLALAAERPALAPPVLVAVAGPIGAGKSTLAAALGEALAATVIDADRTRKQLLGVAPGQALAEGPFRGGYDEATTERTYAELVRRAGLVLGTGRPVILDASFRAARHRAMARALAVVHGVPFRLVECRADPALLRERLAARRGGVSDGRAEILDEFLRSFEPVVELAAEEHVPVDAGAPVAEIVLRVRARVPRLDA